MKARASSAVSIRVISPSVPVPWYRLLRDGLRDHQQDVPAFFYVFSSLCLVTKGQGVNRYHLQRIGTLMHRLCDPMGREDNTTALWHFIQLFYKTAPGSQIMTTRLLGQSRGTYMGAPNFSSARSTILIARSTPAQNPRCEASISVLGCSLSIICLFDAPFTRCCSSPHWHLSACCLYE